MCRKLLTPLIVIIPPLICLIIAIVGLMQLEIETSVREIWVSKDTRLSNKIAYKERVNPSTGSGFSGAYGIITPNNGASVLEKENLLEMIDRMAELENARISHEGNDYNFNDICYAFEAYELPCFRISPIDAFMEGGYAFNTSENVYWFDELVPSELRGHLINFGAYIGQYDQPPTNDCFTTCAMDGQTFLDSNLQPDLVQMSLLVSPSACSDCIRAYNKGMFDVSVSNGTFEWWDTSSFNEYMYYTYAREIIIKDVASGFGSYCSLGSAYDPNPYAAYCYLEALYTGYAEAGALPDTGYSRTFAVANPKSIDDILANLVMPDQLNLDRKVTNPYKWNVGTKLKSGVVGGHRPRISDELECQLTNLSSPVYDPWTGGGFFPEYESATILGSPSPEDFSAKKTLTDVEALQNIYAMIGPEDMVDRVAEDTRPGGALTISKKTAEEVIYKMKLKIEKVFSSGWDKENDLNQYVFFSDDGGALGTFGRELVSRSESVGFLLSMGIFVTFFITFIFFFNPCNLSHSMVGVTFIGVVFVFLGVLAGFGLTCLFGTKLNIVHLWTLPFLFMGIGVDDMYVITTHLRDMHTNDVAVLEAAKKDILVPVTMSSGINFFVFMLLWVAIDIPAIYEVGKTGMYMVVIIWILLTTSYPPILLADIKRKYEGRADVLICVQLHDREIPSNIPIYMTWYEPMVRSTLAHVAFAVIAIIMIVVSFVGMDNSEVGLDIKDFFVKDTQAYEFSNKRLDHFPIWPASMNFGELDYSDPDMQMELIYAWEHVGSTKHMTLEKSTYVWTANYAEWGTRVCTSGAYACGRDWGCNANWTENVKGLIVNGWNSSTGVCRSASYLQDTFGMDSEIYNSTAGYCPVFIGQSQDKMQFCLSKWANFTSRDALSSPGFAEEADGVTPEMPIRYSMASSNLWSTHLTSSDDYVGMIEDARKYCDDSNVKGFDCWMDGGGFRFWEQYLTLVETLWKLVGIALPVTFFVSSIFLIYSQWRNKVAGMSLEQHAARGFVGGLVISCICILSLIFCFGLSCLAGVKITVFSTSSVLLSITFSVEYAVHVVYHFMIGKPRKSSQDCVVEAMEILARPTTMAFTSSAISTGLLGAAEPEFIKLYFFAPLFICVFFTYFNACYLLPILLSWMPWLATRIHNTEEAEFSGIPSTELVSVDGAAKTEVVTIVLPEAENDSPKSTFKHATDTTAGHVVEVVNQTDASIDEGITVQEVNQTDVSMEEEIMTEEGHSSLLSSVADVPSTSLTEDISSAESSVVVVPAVESVEGAVVVSSIEDTPEKTEVAAI